MIQVLNVTSSEKNKQLCFET